jgi:hypothetical protein
MHLVYAAHVVRGRIKAATKVARIKFGFSM